MPGLAWAPDSTRLAISLSTTADFLSIDDYSDAIFRVSTPVLIWNIHTNQQVQTCQGHWAGVSGLAWSPDGTRLAAAGWDATVQVWNAATGAQIFTYQGHAAPTWSVAWSPNGKHLASSDVNQIIRIWEAPILA